MQTSNEAAKPAERTRRAPPAPEEGGQPPLNPCADRAVGRRLQRIRITRGLTQRQVAEALGLSHKQIQNYESGRSRIVVTTLVQFARVFRTSLASLLRDLTEEEAPMRLQDGEDFLLISDAELAHLSQLRELPPELVRPLYRLTQSLARKDGKVDLADCGKLLT